jgi:hypothetical protein
VADAAADSGGDADAGWSAPSTLAQTGLYAQGSAGALAPGVQELTPQFPLWSDGASKRRWLYLPAGTHIDGADQDGWIFPVGTKAWKEFTRDGVRVETRLLEKLPDRWFMMAFAWDAEQSEATAVPDGQRNANGTVHDIPNSADCKTCHDGAADKLLAVSAIQLSHDGDGATLQGLIDAGVLRPAPSGPLSAPGDATARAALGALHANCGSCHNPRGTGIDRAPNLDLWLRAGELDSVEATPTYRTCVDVPVESETVPGATRLIVRGQPDQSALLLRIEAPRRDELTMPPLATELPDDATATSVRSWIGEL